jgi:hypothetical protein
MFISLLALLVAGCDGETRLRGRIVDPEGTPIAQAVVRLDEIPKNLNDSEDKTDRSGMFHVSIMHAPVSTDLVLTVSKDGYQTYREEINSSRVKKEDREIVLVPEERPKHE